MAATPTVLKQSDGGGFLVCDAVLDASIEAQVEVTEHAIEDGSSISDHAIRKPMQLSLTLVCTQTPIYAQYPGTDGTTGLTPTSQELPLRDVAAPGKQTTQLQVREKQGIQLNVAAALVAVSGLLKRATGGGGLSVEGRKQGSVGSRTVSVTVLASDSPQDRLGDFHKVLLTWLTTQTRLTVQFKGQEYSDLVLTSVTKSDAAGQGGRSTYPVVLRQVFTVATKEVPLPKVPAQKTKSSQGAKGGEYGPPLPPAQEARLTSTLASTADAVGG